MQRVLCSCVYNIHTHTCTEIHWKSSSFNTALSGLKFQLSEALKVSENATFNTRTNPRRGQPSLGTRDAPDRSWGTRVAPSPLGPGGTSAPQAALHLLTPPLRAAGGEEGARATGEETAAQTGTNGERETLEKGPRPREGLCPHPREGLCHRSLQPPLLQSQPVRCQLSDSHLHSNDAPRPFLALSSPLSFWKTPGETS